MNCVQLFENLSTVITLVKRKLCSRFIFPMRPPCARDADFACINEINCVSVTLFVASFNELFIFFIHHSGITKGNAPPPETRKICKGWGRATSHFAMESTNREMSNLLKFYQIFIKIF